MRFIGRSSRAGVECNTAKESVVANFRQYGIDVYFMGLVIADASQHQLWYPGTHSSTLPVFDAIITDRKYTFSPKKRFTEKDFDFWKFLFFSYL